MQTTLLPTPKNGSVRKTDNIFSNIYETRNYSQFKIMSDNREINLLHVQRLINSFNDLHLVSPIIVNEKLEVIDGQHRLQASKETGKPVYYIILRGYGIKEVQVLNTNQKNWTKMDYLETYASEGVKPYLQFKQFMADFPDFKIQAAERILSGLGASKSTNIDGKNVYMKYFEEGNFSIPDIKKSYSIARKMMDFKPFYKNFARGTFVSALLPLFSSKVYDHKEMLHKLGSCPIRLRDCDKIETYRLLLEEIYNYKRQKENKVSFRYE
jgi:hypothetical protein